MRFSERMGITPVSDVIQVDGMNGTLRGGLWNVLLDAEFGRTGFLNEYNRRSPRIYAFSKALWADYFKIPVDERPVRRSEVLDAIREYFFGCEWFEVYDFLEFCCTYYGEGIVEPVNAMLERELSAYRVINGRVAPIASPEEVDTVQEALGDPTFPGASVHLKTALDLLSSKTKPDYRNSIKESISAVESACCTITGATSASLGAALKVMAKNHSLHKALTDSFLKLYGYTSDGDGIRHAMLEETSLSQADAIYFLVSCSAFVNYLKSRMTE